MADENRKRVFPKMSAVAFAILAGLVAGVGAVYVRGGFEGNAGLPVAAGAADAADPAATAACAGKEAKAKSTAEAATGEVAALVAADPPRSMKALAFTTPDGKPATLGDFAGKTVLLNLWATWCAPCRAEMPALDALEQKSGGADFQVLAVNVDTGDDAKPKKFLADTKVADLPLYRDPSLRLFDTLKRQGLALGLPVTLIVDREGCLLAHMNGPAEWASADARRLVSVATAR